ncbi:MAG: BrnT family toxin [Stigonema ocellatum SAG 48.90 = DSM 106950]|nr:BrnT family toxin [Stigonema ocellatum SAG 48.90 = DSM 106950]
MDIVYRLQGVEFEWDSNKAESNLEKHGITFEEATEVFFDPFYQSGDATPTKAFNREQRTFILGYSLEPRLLLVIYVERGIRTRIISARTATRTEKKLYELA